MRKTKGLFFFTLLLLAFTEGASAFSWNTDTKAEQFLQRLGFKDYSTAISQTLLNPKLTDVTKKVLSGNSERHEVVNTAKDLSLKIYGAVAKDLNDPSTQQKILKLTAHLLRPHALLSDLSLPTKIKSISEPEKFGEARENFLSEIATQRFLREKQALLTTIVDLILTAKHHSDGSAAEIINDLQDDLDNYLRVKFQYLEFQNTPYWGRAMAALLVRHSRLYSRPEIEQNLKSLLNQQNDWLENYVSNRQFLFNENDQVQTFTLESGDFANEYSHGTEAFYITIGVKPGGRANSKFANKLHLLGSLWEVALYPSPEEEEQIVAKIRSNQPLTEKEQKKFERMKKSTSIKGYSHVGIVEVKEDKESGIKMPWVWDIYPNSDFGGIRFIGPEGFAFRERFQKVGYVRYDSRKFLSYYKQVFSKSGYQENIWDAHEATINDNGEITPDLSKPTALKTKISRQDAKTLASYPSRLADYWYKNLIVPRVLKMMEKYLISEDALGFATGFSNVKGASYCSQALVLAFLQGADIDPEKTEDRWSDFLLMSKKFNLDLSNYFDLNNRVIAPSGFAWQADLVGRETTVLLDSTHRRGNIYDVNLDLLVQKSEYDREISAMIKSEQQVTKEMSWLINDDDL